MGNPAGTEEDYRGQSATTSGAGQRMEGPAALAVRRLRYWRAVTRRNRVAYSKAGYCGCLDDLTDVTCSPHGRATRISLSTRARYFAMRSLIQATSAGGVEAAIRLTQAGSSRRL